MSQVAKRSIAIRNHKTSISLEDEFWSSLREIALTEGTNLKDLIAESIMNALMQICHAPSGSTCSITIDCAPGWQRTTRWPLGTRAPEKTSLHGAARRSGIPLRPVRIVQAHGRKPRRRRSTLIP